MSRVRVTDFPRNIGEANLPIGLISIFNAFFVWQNKCGSCLYLYQTEKEMLVNN